MKSIVGALAVLLVSALSVAAQAQPQRQVPRGSYRQSCHDVQVQGDTLSAVCSREDGRWQRTVLRDVDNCVGDIGNDNGALRCNRRRGGGGPPPPAYGQYGRRQEQAQRCARLGERQERLRGQLAQTPEWDQDRQAQLRDQLRDTREDYRRLGCQPSYGGHRDRCERLDADRDRIRQQLDQTPSWDRDRRERLRDRLHEARERFRDEGCDQQWRAHQARCERLGQDEQQTREQLQGTPFWKTDHRAALQRRLDDLRDRARRERCAPPR